MENKKLIVLVGLPRSGKSTRAQMLSKKLNAPIVNPDSVRKAIHGQAYIQSAEPFVWATTKAMVTSLFLAGHDTVLIHACNNTKRRRDEWRFGDWELLFEVMKVPKETCVARATEKGLLKVIERMAAQHEPVSDEEGVARIVRVDHHPST